MTPNNFISQLPLATNLLLLLLLLILPSLCRSAASQLTIDLSTKIETGSRLDGDPFATFSPKGMLWCAEECKRRSRCSSFNYKRADLTCELNDRNGATGIVLPEAGSVFSEASAWPDDMIGACNTVSCPVNARCESVGDNAICIPTDCSDASPNVTDAQRDLDSREIGHTVTYTCNEGLIPEGTPSVTCKICGEWTAVQFHCRDCGDPPVVPLASPTASVRTVGSTMTYTCEGRPLENGPAEVVCDSHGYWTAPTFVCIGFRTSVNGNSGHLVSPNYPGEYYNNADDTITVCLDQAGPQTVAISMTYNLEVSSTGCFDYIEINGDGNQRCGTASGVTLSLNVDGSCWTVLFHSDSSVPRPAGFLLTYSV